MPTALTIAGSDSSGGAGIQADLKAFAAHGVYGTCALTAITAQNTQRILESVPLPAALVTAQITAILEDFDVHATKIGMLATGEIATAVAGAIRRHGLRHVVLDTVMLSTSGTSLLDRDGVSVLRGVLLPLAEVVTVNLPEAEALTGLPITSREDGREAVRHLLALGARAVVLKGGHFAGDATDLLHDGQTFTAFEGERIATRHTHGTGCTLAAAIAARLAEGATLVEAVRTAKQYVTEAIRHAPALGHGRGPLNHFFTRDGSTSA